MKSGMRIIKRGREDGPLGSTPGRDEKTEMQRERDMAGTVKGWVAECEQRRRQGAVVALAELRSARHTTSAYCRVERTRTTKRVRV